VAVSLFGSKTMDELTASARKVPRRRINANLHASYAHPSQRVMIAMEPDSYSRPHRHCASIKDETLLVLRGSFGLLCFDEGGNVTTKALLREGGETIGCNVPAGTFHTLVCLEPGSVFFEAKAGPYDASTDKEWAPWAPEEGHADAPAYLEKLRQLVA
jgi:cupin fold WbuC family metalloprotein